MATTARVPIASRRAAVRREREREIVAATRALFDERGMQDAPIDEIARAVGINKALIYRCFASKEELFVLTLTSYLAELAKRLDSASVDHPRSRAHTGGGANGVPNQNQHHPPRHDTTRHDPNQHHPTQHDAAQHDPTPHDPTPHDPTPHDPTPHDPTQRHPTQRHPTPQPATTSSPSPPRALATSTPETPEATRRLEAGWRCYTDFCIEYPAFVDCGVSLMRRPAEELHESISDAVWIRLGAAMANCLSRLSEILAAGAREGAFAIADADFMANHLYTQTLGSMLLARIGVGVQTGAGGVPEPFAIDARRVQEACIADVLAAVGAQRTASD